MKKNIAFLVFVFITTSSFSQKKAKDMVDLSLIKPNKIDLFDYRIFESKKENARTYERIIVKEKAKSKMPIFDPKGNFSLKVVKVDTTKTHSLRIQKIE